MNDRKTRKAVAIAILAEKVADKMLSASHDVVARLDFEADLGSALADCLQEYLGSPGGELHTLRMWVTRWIESCEANEVNADAMLAVVEWIDFLASVDARHAPDASDA